MIKLAAGIFNIEGKTGFVGRRQLIHGINQDAFTDTAETAGTKLLFHCFFHHEVEYLIINDQVDAFQFK